MACCASVCSLNSTAPRLVRRSGVRRVSVVLGAGADASWSATFSKGMALSFVVAKAFAWLLRLQAHGTSKSLQIRRARISLISA